MMAMASDRSTSTFSRGSGIAKPASKITSSKEGIFGGPPPRAAGNLSLRAASRPPPTEAEEVSCPRALPKFEEAGVASPGLSSSMMLPGCRSPCMNWLQKIIRIYAAIVCLAISPLRSAEMPKACLSASARAVIAAAVPGTAVLEEEEQATSLAGVALKIFASSSPASRVSTNASGVTKSGAGKRTASPLQSKFARKRRKCEASLLKSVCICMCSQNSSVACRTPSIRSVSTRSASWLKRSSHARSASSSERTPGLRHFTATSVPSSSCAKKTSAMLPEACALGSIDLILTSLSRRESATSLEVSPSDHRAET
mmetsp:Transcript_105642/g.268349  ORF Transcript_105642/g.268349 Transcript_105642/m.268349 type:complete len:313 (-) Transcript_105642:648-1586(-)